MTQRPAIDVAQIKAMLLDRLEQLVAELLPAGERDGDEYRCGNIDGGAGRSLAVHMRAGPRLGVWADFAEGHRGDVLDLIAACRCQGDTRASIAWARQWLGLEHVPPEQLERQRREARARAEQRERLRDRDEEQRERRAYGQWYRAGGYADSPAEIYLRDTRGVDFRELGRAPRALRYAPDVISREIPAGSPCMLALCARYELPADRIVNPCVHRTFLSRTEDGRWIKNPSLGKASKKFAGVAKGAFIPLWRGESGKPYREAPDGDTMMVSEGIEDGGTAIMACPQFRCIAGLSVNNLKSITLPRGVQRVILIGQHDTDPGTLLQRDFAVRAWRGQGKRVDVYLPPAVGKDVNDYLRSA